GSRQYQHRGHPGSQAARRSLGRREGGAAGGGTGEVTWSASHGSTSAFHSNSRYARKLPLRTATACTSDRCAMDGREGLRVHRKTARRIGRTVPSEIRVARNL